MAKTKKTLSILAKIAYRQYKAGNITLDDIAEPWKTEIIEYEKDE